MKRKCEGTYTGREEDWVKGTAKGGESENKRELSIVASTPAILREKSTG